MEKIIKTLMKEAEKAYRKREVPVGCVVVRKNKIIGRAHNTKQKGCCCINHAEILAIKKAGRKIKDWRLNDCELFVTLEPCKMCMEVIRQSRIKKVFYILKSNFTNEDFKKIDVLPLNVDPLFIENYKMKMKAFFSIKR